MPGPYRLASRDQTRDHDSNRSAINGTWLTHQFPHPLEEADLPEIDYHGLRHTAGTFLAYLGVSAPAIRDLLRYTQLSTTDVYLHSIPHEHVKAMRRMEGLLGKGA